jgi:hypothetical protein
MHVILVRKKKAEKEFRLEDHLILAQTIASKIGIDNLEDITKLSDNSEGYEIDGKSRMYHRLVQKRGNLKLSGEILQKYDENIEAHLMVLRNLWGPDFNLKYFQYLAVLFAEIYLDQYFQGPRKFLTTINTWNKNRGSKESIPRRKITNKLAYWMATGSGKTIIMHINLLQFLKYNNGPYALNYENIILVTSNDNMSEQHKKDLHKSGIKAELFDGTNRGKFGHSKNVVKIISISKLKQPWEKKGEGVTIDVSSFGTRNLVLIDEGHKGQKSNEAKWKTVREKLAEDGFIWEYSATFGQTITSKKSPYFDEYRYSILFDYSYKYFHKDGFGKDFQILNLKTSEFEDQYIPTLLLANTMSYYEQLQIFEKTPNIIEYNIKKPLWIFVGSKVNKEDSDIHQVVQFLHQFFKEKKESIIGKIENILNGKTGIPGSNNRDAFKKQHPEINFRYLRELKISPDTIYNGILEDVFNIKLLESDHQLELLNIRNAEGEIGLKTKSSDYYFGVINIGDKSKFLKMIQTKTPEIKVRADTTGDSQFKAINDRDSKINLLLGSKKFIEGWNSWRVSSMCLLNIGKSEGPQIIQLFGRGVRLQGQNMTLKRSRELPGIHPPYLDIIETLKIYGIQANYLKHFKDYIDQEITPQYYLQIDTSKDHLNPFPFDLFTLTVKDGYEFKQHLFEFDHEAFIDEQKYPIIDLLPKTDIINSITQENLQDTQQRKEQVIKGEILELLDWNEIYYEILEYKQIRTLYNIHIKKKSLKPIIENHRYRLYCDPQLIQPTKYCDISKTKDIILHILKKCIDRYYTQIRLAEEKQKIQLTQIMDERNRLIDKYEVSIKTKDPQIVKIIEDITDNIDERDYQTRLSGNYIIPAYFANHMYQPLLSQPSINEVSLKPSGLNEGETQFVRDLEKYVNTHTIKEEVYLLRNLTRGKGVGFFEENSFYPDFILWLKHKDNKKQKIVFIDPKGIVHHNLNDPKLTLHKHLKEEIQPTINNPNVTFDAFIISVTPISTVYNRFKKTAETLADENHLLFMYQVDKRLNPKYIETLFDLILK